MTTSLTFTDEQKKFLDECEGEFKNRWTDDDSNYVKIKNGEKSVPPIVDPWYKKQPGRFDWTKQNRGNNKRRHDNWDNDQQNDRAKHSRYNDRGRYDRNRY